MSKRNHAAVFGRWVVVLTAVLLTALGLPALAGTADAATDPVVSVVNADDGLYWRSDANQGSRIPLDGEGVYTGDKVSLQCFERGGVVPPYNNNPLWYRATVVSGRGVGSGMVNDHFLNTGSNQPNVPVTGVGPCGLTTFDAVPPAVFGGLNPGKGFGFHDWGPCRVQDFYFGTEPHLIVHYVPQSGLYHLVHGGMLAGWLSLGGAPGKLGCPKGGEYTTYDKSEVYQDFDGGQLVWRPGMRAAVLR